MTALTTGKIHMANVSVQPIGKDRWFFWHSERWQVRHLAKRIAASRGYTPDATVPDNQISFDWGGKTYMILSGKGEVREI
jgi:hypothetical protein